MAWITVIEEDEAKGELKDLYNIYKAPWGGVDNVLKIHGIAPKALKPHVDLYRVIMFGRSPLSRPQREMIGVVVSATNACHYCVNHHGDALYRLTKDKALVTQLRTAYRDASIPDREKIMLDFSVALTISPRDHHEDSIKQLKAEGFTDEEIHDIVVITSYFNFVNRIVQDLGVELEQYWDEDGFSRKELAMAHDRKRE